MPSASAVHHITVIAGTVFAAGDIAVFTSELTLCEMLVSAFRTNDNLRLALYCQRGSLGRSTSDAIHVATAQESACTAFLTNDGGPKVPKDVTRVWITDDG
jgi:hypothetical protein